MGNDRAPPGATLRVPDVRGCGRICPGPLAALAPHFVPAPKPCKQVLRGQGPLLHRQVPVWIARATEWLSSPRNYPRLMHYHRTDDGFRPTAPGLASFCMMGAGTRYTLNSTSVQPVAEEIATVTRARCALLAGEKSSHLALEGRPCWRKGAPKCGGHSGPLCHRGWRFRSGQLP